MSFFRSLRTFLREVDAAFEHARTGRRPDLARPPEIGRLPPELRADIGWPDGCTAHNMMRGDTGSCRR